VSTLFISDLHLDDSRPAVTRAFLHLLRYEAPAAESLYILGDFFEVWVGDDNDSPLIREVIDGLKQLTEKSTPVFIMHGNRDFLLGQQFCRKTGCTLINDPTVIALYNKPVLLMHGDSLCTEDAHYQAFRQQVRSPEWQQQLLEKPLAERLAIAKQLREASMEANSNKAEDILDVTPSEVQTAMKQHNVEVLIHGHTHRPAIHQENPLNTRIVLGDWDQQGWSLLYHPDGSYELNNFPIR
jgi:UDP-2,3-diacylglucosamine hydrolase